MASEAMERPEGMPSRGKIWWLALRPRTLGAAIAPVLMGGALAAGDHGFFAPAFLAALLCAVLIQISANFANDYFDFIKGKDTEKRQGPTRATQAGWVTPAQMRRALGLVNVLAFALGLYLVYRGGRPILIIGALSLICAILYTAGPYPIGYIGLGDLFVFIFFGPVAVGGTYYVQTLSWSPTALWAGIAPGLLSMAILAVNNLRDVEEDRGTGKRTLAVRFGPNFARWEYVSCLIGGIVVIPISLCLLHPGRWLVLLALGALIPAAASLRGIFLEKGPVLNGRLAATGKLLVLFSLLFSLGWLTTAWI